MLLHAQATKAGRENAEVGLPPGWAAVWSASRAVWYWRNNDFGEVLWEKTRKERGGLLADDADPAAAAEADAKADLPPGWAAVWSRSKSRWYWRRGDETMWSKPEGKADEAPLPPGWTEHMSRSKGIPYYKNGDRVSWERPSSS